ncbi:MAG: ADP-forming succinate--CoA ligase subunit beta [Pseudomonadota bacterium]|nr:ADP-forming succinate--CoA ligase subunit beta [Pseudomonadota bacterium]
MNLHEYQSKNLFAEYGIPVQAGEVARSAEEAVKNAKSLGGEAWLVKAQVHAGGRGKAGGVKFTTDLKELESSTKALIGSQLITKQSAPDGQPVNCVLIAAAADIEHELYLGAIVDRASRRVTFMGSRAGGMDIEEVAATTPEKIVTVHIDPSLGIQDYQCRTLAFGLELDKEQRNQLQKIVHGLYRLFTEKDVSLIEINPLAILKDKSLCAVDAKINIDDNALYRQEIAEWRDPSQEDEKERKAQEFDLNYVTLDGDIACMVNGAGLAMATMDIIKLTGGQPANFLDVGGGTTAQRVAEAFKIIVSDPKIKAILVNIFGGIVRCDLIAEVIITAVKEVGINVPIVVRLEGTNVEAGKKMLAESGLDIMSADHLSDAAEKVVTAARGVK